ncbi:putative quinol monooxygenase [Luminiphilus syltensis]|nr:antibiotic biosynthesis monooxygenase [Luminiphilus syltensis]
MTVIISGYLDFENPEDVPKLIASARPHIEGALSEEGCIAYSWTEDHLTRGRIWVYEEWSSSETLSAHLKSHWYTDMAGHLASYSMKPGAVVKKYRVDLEEPVYDEDGNPRGDFFTADG